MLYPRRYDMAWQSCQSALESLTRSEHGAATFGGKRASVVRSIATGYTPPVPAGLKPPRTAAAAKEIRTIAWKSQVRFAKAHSGIMQNKIKAKEQPSEVKKVCDLAVGGESLCCQCCREPSPLTLLPISSVRPGSAH